MIATDINIGNVPRAGVRSGPTTTTTRSWCGQLKGKFANWPEIGFAPAASFRSSDDSGKPGVTIGRFFVGIA